MVNIKTYIHCLAVEVTRRCNMSCKFCAKGKAQNLDISTEIIDKIIDEMKDNICLNPDCELPLFFSIDYEDIKKIKNIISENEYVFKIKNVQSPDWILDGSRQELYFWNKEIFNKIETSNLDKWESHECKYRNTKIILKIVNEIAQILEKYEINLLKGC